MSENGADRLSESTRGRDRRARRVGQVGSERRLLWIVAVYLLVIGTILGYNAIATASERDAALVVNVAARQRAVAERYIKDVLLSLSGYPADPQADAQALQENAVALLDGGTVDAVQGAPTGRSSPNSDRNDGSLRSSSRRAMTFWREVPGSRISTNGSCNCGSSARRSAPSPTMRSGR